jgi:hypothetical protein
MIVRPTGSGNRFKIIGPCQVHGLMDGEALIGALPHPWAMVFYRDSMGVSVQHFSNKETGELTTKDPRLGNLPEGWERVERDRTVDDPRWFTWFANKVTGETVNADPRMREDELGQRGVKLRRFEIV